jgi:hypothetical protein
VLLLDPADGGIGRGMLAAGAMLLPLAGIIDSGSRDDDRAPG